MKKLLIVCMFLLVGGSANAALITFGPSSASGSGPTISFNNLVVPSTIMGNATVTLSVNGDFNSNFEYLDILFDAFSLGRVFDGNTANDLFNFAGDIGNQSRSTLTGVAIISAADFAALISDGLLNLSFDSSSRVNCCGTINVLSGSISYDSKPVPAPSTIVLFSLVLLGGVYMTRKRKA
ncbi:PEP-CTERM sorting domain-containing protein [Alteromonas sp. W364]|uniref:PEP-CTERM sorting domain-containing protein n=1 Tax=Alteromonas sp. W364 TaxID=3075610 RepID=UPI002883DDE9|nr:PEP-CTERM sorting domain-containing protein [Alteromonas sp. W364]MDT0629057.1 PEP-CTERM sorting domain-containing protein [Alteromonas sp. W364]